MGLFDECEPRIFLLQVANITEAESDGQEKDGKDTANDEDERGTETVGEDTSEGKADRQVTPSLYCERFLYASDVL